jgi:hypothetical protein
MELSIITLKNDVISQEKGPLFEQEFPKLDDAIIELREKPFCSICIKKVVTIIMTDPDVMSKLELIYGDKIQLNEDMKKALVWHNMEKKKIMVERIPIDKWEDWVSTFFIDVGNKVKNFVTAYDPDKKEMIVTVLFFSVQNRVMNEQVPPPFMQQMMPPNMPPHIMQGSPNAPNFSIPPEEVMRQQEEARKRSVPMQGDPRIGENFIYDPNMEMKR